MEKIVKDIIDADRHAREAVAEMEAKRYQLDAVLKEQRKQITTQYEMQSAQKKEAYQAELEAQLIQHQKTCEEEYQEITATLQKQFQKEKDAWVQEIYEHCLNA